MKKEIIWTRKSPVGFICRVVKFGITYNVEIGYFPYDEFERTFNYTHDKSLAIKMAENIVKRGF